MTMSEPFGEKVEMTESSRKLGPQHGNHHKHFRMIRNVIFH